MNKNELKIYLSIDNKSGYKTKENHIKYKFPDHYQKINEFEKKSDYPTNIKFTQKLYNYLNDIFEIQKCLNCGCEIKWKNKFSEGYQKYCSFKCSSSSGERIKNIVNTNLEKYGVEHISQLDDVKEKKKNTLYKKYGIDVTFKIPEIIEKINNTNLDRYGTISPIKNNNIKEKRKLNNIEKYGVEHTSQLDDVKEKICETNMKKYGVSSVMQVPEIKNKLNNKKIEKRFNQYREILENENIKFSINNNNIIVENQCDKHLKYEINYTTFYYRVLFYNLENPCPICNPISKKTSIKENEINKFITNELLLKTRKKYIDRKEIDIFVDNHSIGIEFNGLYWHSELYKDKNYHLNKYEICKKNNIQLLQIFEDEWVYKKNIVKSIIKSKLGLLTYSVYGRKCVVRVIQHNEASIFLEKNHIQGNYNSKYNIGLFYDNELVSLMTFTKIRFEKNINGYELTRFCNKINTNVIGGASKLLKYFIKNYNPSKIVSFADKRYSNGNLYKKLGFEYINDVKPSYYYFNLKNNQFLKRYSRFDFQKKNIINEDNKNLTEHEIMLKNGYVRIYNAGNIKFELKI